MCPTNDNTELGAGPEAGALTLMLGIALSRIQDKQADPEAFLDWMREFAPQIAPAAFPFPSDHDKAVAAYWLGVSLWNATPLADNHYRPRPLPPPQRNQPCPCGSGRKFKHCCRDVVKTLERRLSGDARDRVRELVPDCDESGVTPWIDAVARLATFEPLGNHSRPAGR
mgnify:CR=1 FL=1